MLFLGRIARWYRERIRNIFSYHDGVAWRRADPLLVGTKLDELCPDYQDLLDTISKNTADMPVGGVRDDLVRQQREAVMKLDGVARKLFGLKLMAPHTVTVEPGVLSVSEAVAILAQYWNFMHALAEDATLFPVSRATA